ncbi:N-acetylglucosamine kinase [Pseudonocardia sp. TRM90224]|uniref:N-acetylglucosamine kinase n=1 Tax=Pseudonocardia sp. TRM90224 TaxID=2812678 RepID=UPI001E3A1A4F|nr:BadF/BadG/BcrA/BcrD ATPase family protein [Pseudonocardia sp. TRM90224]
MRVAVDGGQSQLRLTVVGSGRVHVGPGFSYAADVVPGIVAAVATAWAEVVADEPVERAALGLTGLPATAEGRERLGAAVAELLPTPEVLLCADNVTAHAGALGGARGVALTVGTGVNCLAVDPEAGFCHRVDGWGHLFGDDGSAFAIGRAGIAAALRAHDGRGAPTKLSELVEERFGALDEVPQRLYTSPTRVDDIARFAVVVLGAADEVAGAIVRNAGAELARTARAAVDALPGAEPVPVACTGRLVESSPQLLAALRAGLDGCERARLVPAAGSALSGACFLAEAADLRGYGPLLHVFRRGGVR